MSDSAPILNQDEVLFICVLCRNDADKTLMRPNVNAHLLPIRLKSESETVHVYAHGFTLVQSHRLTGDFYRAHL